MLFGLLIAFTMINTSSNRQGKANVSTLESMMTAFPVCCNQAIKLSLSKSKEKYAFIPAFNPSKLSGRNVSQPKTDESETTVGRVSPPKPSTVIP